MQQEKTNTTCNQIYQPSILSFSSVQSLSRIRLFETSWTTAFQASLSITNSRSLPKPMSIVSVMPSNHLILCCPLLLLPSIFPSIRVFSNVIGHLPTWGSDLSVSYHFAFSYCSWGSQGKNSEVVCHSLLQWTTSVRPHHHDPTILGGPTRHGLVSLS